MSAEAHSRRTFIAHATRLAAGAAMLPSAAGLGQTLTTATLKICLTPGSIGVAANQQETIALALRFGFDAVEPFGGYLASLNADQLSQLVADLKTKGLSWGAAGLPVDFRRGEDSFRRSMDGLPKIARALNAAGAQRVGTWLTPADNTLTYLANLKLHVRRLGEAARVLKDHDLRLGLEYVGTQSSRRTRKYSFVHTLAETKDLIGEIGTGNIGVILDSWHWWQADDTVEEIEALRNEEVVSVDLNDAPAGVAKADQRDGRRELPATTQVIDLTKFLSALRKIGYDGPARAEPFNETLNKMDNEAACQATIQAMRKACALP